jgi:ribulose-5-phosphate 4-epimerase/fuculose-1-phosphate aldolase
MSLQRVQSDLVRVYSAARAHVGDPGDLASIGKNGTAYTTPPPVLGKLQDPRAGLVQATRELFEQGLITATGGNLSIRIEGKNELWITPSQLFKGDLSDKVMVRIDLEGNALDADALAPSSERLVHTEILKARSDCQVVVHAHAPYATMLALSGIPFMPITTEAAFLKELPVVPFIMPGTRELALEVVKHLGKSAAALMQNHGVVVAASSMRRACVAESDP